MVIGFNPSHSNINSEVNAPFKILSTLLRFLKSEYLMPGGKNKMVFKNNPQGIINNYQMPRKKDDLSGERLDTMEGYGDLYDDEEEEGMFGLEDEDDRQKAKFVRHNSSSTTSRIREGLRMTLLWENEKIKD
jgi:hypothetical protein